ncbi:MAG TPA: hypothetical protein VLC95_14020 [Anaerolineae bacterium]|nr:hypothetical protein [Anaerolineae bacterium]
MNKITLALALLTLLGLFLALPAFAQEGDECMHADATIADLRACVEHAYEQGHITNRGVLRTLLAQLDAAQAAHDRGQTTLAINLLQSFIYTIEAQAGRTILEPHAQHIVAHAQNVIQALGQ